MVSNQCVQDIFPGENQIEPLSPGLGDNSPGQAYGTHDVGSFIYKPEEVRLFALIFSLDKIYLKKNFNLD